MTSAMTINLYTADRSNNNLCAIFYSIDWEIRSSKDILEALKGLS